MLIAQSRGMVAELGAQHAHVRRRAKLGEGLDERLQFANILAQVYAQTGRIEEAEPFYRELYDHHRTTKGDDDPATRLAAGQLGVLLNAKSQKLDEAGSSDPAALARVYTEAADLLLPNFGAEDEDVVRCRRRAEELLKK